MKNIVIIGAQGGGAASALELQKSLPEDYRIVLIERQSFTYWAVGGLRAAVKPGYENEVFATLDNFFGKGSRHIVLAGYHVKQVKENSIILDKPAPAPFDSEEIEIEAGIIASGTKYPIPMRPMSTDLEESLQGLRNMQQEVGRAEHILIVGAGPVGVEFAGEVLSNHPSKKITIVDLQKELFPNMRAVLGKMILQQLKDLKVDIRLGTGLELTKEHFENAQKLTRTKQIIQLSDGSQVETDFLFIANGGSPNTDLVPEDALDNNKPRRIDVNKSTLRLNHASLGKKWFAVGDVSSTPYAKTFVNAKNEGPVAAAQLLGLITGSKSTKGLKEPAKIMLVPIGERGGAGQMVWPVVGQWITSLIKGRGLFTDGFIKTYPGGKAVKA